LPLNPATNHIGTPFIELQSVDSTNNYALGRVHEGMAYHGTCFFAHEQTAGKGQRGKLWIANKDVNITLSIVLKPDFLQPFQQFQLSACVAAAIQQFLSKYTGDVIRIKWPNDLYWKDRKLGGILIENIVRNRKSEVSCIEWSVAGIGINVNQTKFPEDLPNPVSLKQITGKNFDPVGLAKELCQSVDLSYKKLMNEGMEPILEQYNKFLFKKNETIKLKKDNRVFEVIIKAVEKTGQLVTEHAFEERFNFGEIEWLI